ncbi:MAG: hypothetical protein KDJ52_18260 [Anaerolineae bacterium]|nr:hypothetical protein [Anaerolineae bacterium]
MSLILSVSKHLSIELLPGTDKSEPALRLFIPDDPEQAFVVFQSEIHLLRDSLIDAGAQLAKLEKQARKLRD